MLREIKNLSQIPGEPFRRWYCDEIFELILWYQGEKLSGFQLCYKIDGTQKALTWLADSGSSHKRVDDGEHAGHCKMTPILVPDGLFEKDCVISRLKERAADLPYGLISFIIDRLEDHVRARTERPGN